MRSYVSHFIKKCPCCQIMSRLKTPIETQKFVGSTYKLMERISWDTIGPLDKDEYGYEYVIAIIDTFSRYIELFPARSLEADEAVICLIQHVGKFGIPSQIHSDRGTQYVNSLITELKNILGIEQIISTAYSHEENTMIERPHKESMKHLRAMLFEKDIAHERWSIRLPLIERIMNTQVHSSIGVAPYKLVINNSIQLDKNIFIDNMPSLMSKYGIKETGKLTKGIGSWAADQLRAQALLMQIAEINQRSKDKSHLAPPKVYIRPIGQPVAQLSKKTKVDKSKKKKTSITDPYPIDSFVLLDYPESVYHKGPPAKLMGWKNGPFRVVEIVGSDITIVDILKDTQKTVHISRLSEFKYDEAYTSPYDVATANNKLLEVEKIIQSRNGHADQKKNLEFLVKWTGFSEDRNTWVPYKDMAWNILYYDWCKVELTKFQEYVTLMDGNRFVYPPEINSPEKKKELKKQWKKTITALSNDITRFENDFKIAEAEKQTGIKL